MSDDLVDNFLYRSTGQGTCHDRGTGVCSQPIAESQIKSAPFSPDIPALVFGIDNLLPETGQTAIALCGDGLVFSG